MTVVSPPYIPCKIRYEILKASKLLAQFLCHIDKNNPLPS